MAEFIAHFQARHLRHAIFDDAALPGIGPKSVAKPGPGWQRRTANRLEARFWRPELCLLSHGPES